MVNIAVDIQTLSLGVAYVPQNGVMAVGREEASSTASGSAEQSKGPQQLWSMTHRLVSSHEQLHLP